MDYVDRDRNSLNHMIPRRIYKDGKKLDTTYDSNGGVHRIMKKSILRPRNEAGLVSRVKVDRVAND